MRWIVRLGSHSGGGLYLPQRHHIDEPLRPRLPVTSPYAARFATKKLATAAVEYARTKGYTAEHPEFGKIYPRSWAPEHTPLRDIATHGTHRKLP
jgi:hypothetical protein